MDSITTFAEQTVTGVLHRMGPCFLDDLIIDLSSLGWQDVVMAIERMSEDGRVVIIKVGLARYQIVLTAQLETPRFH